MTLYVHEVHRVIGTREDEFESRYRDPGGWMDRLGQADDARLLGYFHQAHGTGLSYRVVTITAVRDGAAWERLARSVHGGDLAELAAATDGLRHGVAAKVLVPTAFSPLADLDLATVPAAPADHAPALYMEDTMWPDRGLLRDYLAGAERQYAPLLERAESLLRIEAALVTALGAGTRPEVVLLQSVKDPAAIVRLLTTELGPEHRPPGSWMHDALTWRDQWESRLLRSVGWSPRW